MTQEELLHVRVRARVGALSLDVELAPGPGTLVVVGPNGAGKSSLLSAVLGVLPVTEGRIAVGGVALLDTAARIDVPLEHRRLGYVPQEYALFPHLTVRGNVAFAVRSASLARHAGRDARHDAAAVEDALRTLGITALADRRVHALSGGEKQRVALARALAIEPRALLLDEPLAALDVGSRREVRGFLAATLARLALPTVIVAHDAADARVLGERIAVLEAGRITQLGTWAELSARPASRFVEELIGSATESSPRARPFLERDVP